MTPWLLAAAGAIGLCGCDSTGFSWHTFILPFVEQASLYNQLNFQLGIWQQPNGRSFPPSSRLPSVRNYGLTIGDL